MAASTAAVSAAAASAASAASVAAVSSAAVAPRQCYRGGQSGCGSRFRSVARCCRRRRHIRALRAFALSAGSRRALAFSAGSRRALAYSAGSRGPSAAPREAGAYRQPRRRSRHWQGHWRREGRLVR
jgi:hypothetical protein